MTPARRTFQFVFILFRMSFALAFWIVGRSFMGVIIGGCVGGLTSVLLRMAFPKAPADTATAAFGGIMGLFVGALVGIISGLWIVVREVRNEVLKGEKWDTKNEGW